MNIQQRLVLLALVLVLSCARAMEIDEEIAAAAETDHTLDFDHDNETVLVETDMLYPKADYEEMLNSHSPDPVKRDAIRSYRWTNGIVPYDISDYFSGNEKNVLMAAIQEWETVTCIRFRPADNDDRNRIQFIKGDGCYSYVGMQNKAQVVSLGEGCIHTSIILHEIGHAVGFFHEQSRPDRDYYVRIAFENIKPGKDRNFGKQSTSTVYDFNVPYDYKSVMHYGSKYFSRNGRPTILTKDSSMQNVIGNARDLSFRDIKQANLMYKCNAHCTEIKSCPGEGFIGKDCKCWCIGNPVQHCQDSGSVHELSGNSDNKNETDCKNYHDNCGRWAAEGYCSHLKFKSYMASHCRQACNICCGDGTSECAARAERGECQDPRYATFMLHHCQESCKLCSIPDRCKIKKTCPEGGFIGGDCECWCPGNPPKHCQIDAKDEKLVTGCRNKDTRCSIWAAKGRCKHPKYIVFMTRYCPQSCSICCGDSMTRCATYAQQGYCTKSLIIQRRCRKSCNSCGPKECRNLSIRCSGWAMRGYCNDPKIKDVITKVCPQSCNICCGDGRSNCAVWAEKGHCKHSKYGGYMSRVCQKSCELCSAQEP